MRMVRSVLFVIWLYASMAVIGILALPVMVSRRLSLKAIGLYARIIAFGLRWIAGVRLELRGREHIPPGPLLIAGKHQSMLDVFMPFILFDAPVVIMKRELLWYPVLGWYALRTGMIAIDRSGTTRTLKQMISQAKGRAEDGRQILIYPEGTRREPGAEPDYKTAGIGALYSALDVPVLPLATNSGLCWPARGIRRNPGRVVYECLPPLPGGENRKKTMAELQAQLETASDRLLEEGLRAQGRL